MPGWKLDEKRQFEWRNVAQYKYIYNKKYKYLTRVTSGGIASTHIYIYISKKRKKLKKNNSKFVYLISTEMNCVTYVMFRSIQSYFPIPPAINYIFVYQMFISLLSKKNKKNIRVICEQLINRKLWDCAVSRSV